MPWRLALFDESVDAADALNAIAPLTDPTMAIDGDFLRIPPGRNQLLGYGLLNSSGGTNRGRLTSPTLSPHPIDIEPRVHAVVWGSPPELNMTPRNPRTLVELEGLSMEQRSDPVAGERQYGPIFLGSGPVEPVQGQMLSIRFTASITLVVTAWTNGAITLAQSLPVGNYDVVGLRLNGANGVVGRLVFTDQVDRPGGPFINADADLDHPAFRFGGMGVWGSFSSLFLPSLDAVGVTDTTQIGFLDLIRRT